MLFGDTLIQTERGAVAVSWSQLGLWELGSPRPSEAEALADIEWMRAQRKTAKRIVPVPDAAAVEAVMEQFLPVLTAELQSYWQGNHVEFTVPVDWRGYTEFQRSVLAYTATIPYGQTESYGAVARQIGLPRAVRAVGGALHINRTLIVVPCHRVIGADGSLVGFGSGLDLKKELLILEKILPI